MLRAGTRVEQASTRHLSPTPPGVWPAGRAKCAQSRGNTGTQLLENGPVGNIGQGPGSHPPRPNLVVDRPPGWTRYGLAPTTSRDKTLCACALEVPRTTLRCGRDPTLKHCLRCANASLHVQCCDANIRLAARLRIRSLLEAHRAHTNSTTQALLWYRSPAHRCTSRFCPTRACPHLRCLLHGVWWEELYRTCTVSARYHGGLWVPSQTAESPHCLSDPILSLSRRPSLACASFGKTFCTPQKHAAPSQSMPCNHSPRTGRAW